MDPALRPSGSTPYQAPPSPGLPLHRPYTKFQYAVARLAPSTKSASSLKALNPENIRANTASNLFTLALLVLSISLRRTPGTDPRKPGQKPTLRPTSSHLAAQTGN